MKRWMLFLLALMIGIVASTAMAESLLGSDYTDVPTTMTQDSVLEIKANEGCAIEALQPDEESVTLLENVYQFVWTEGNAPARYYDEETQRKISELAGGVDIDLLHMTEAMRLQLTGAQGNPVTAEMLLDVDYRVDQLIIVVLGIPQGDGAYVWYPYRGRVETVGEIKWDMPAEDWAALSLQPISYHVLTDRIGARGERLSHEEQDTDRYEIFSKDAGDVVKTLRWYTESGVPIEDDFRVWLTELTEPMQDEVARIGEHVANGGAILDYFPEERQAEVALMLGEAVDTATLVPYDIIALRDDNYKDTYGDVNAEIIFGTAYQTDKAMTILAGFPIEDAQRAPWMEWYVLRAEALEPEKAGDTECSVEIGLKQLILPRMEEEPLMLVVISEPVDQE